MCCVVSVLVFPAVGSTTYPERQDLLHAEHPCPPPVFSDAYILRVPDLDRVQWPVRWELHSELEALLVDRVRRRDLVDGARDLDCDVLVLPREELRGGARVLDTRELRADDRGREVPGGVGGDGRGELPVAAVDEPGADERWDEEECAIVEVRGEKAEAEGGVRSVY